MSDGKWVRVFRGGLNYMEERGKGDVRVRGDCLVEMRAFRLL